MKIEIRPLESKRWHGKTGSESFTRPKKLQALVDASTRTYATGLSKEEQKKYEEKLKVDLSNNFDPEVPHKFWDSTNAVVKLSNSTMFFDLDLPMDFIKYKICQASKYPEATHVIYNQAAEAEVKASKIILKNSAIEKSSKLSMSQKIEIILILSGKNLKNQSNEFILVAMDKIIQDDPEGVLRYIEYSDRDFVSSYALVIECLQKSVLVKQGHKIMYHDSSLGNDETSVAQYLQEPENQELKLILMKTINS